MPLFLQRACVLSSFSFLAEISCITLVKVTPRPCHSAAREKPELHLVHLLPLVFRASVYPRLLDLALVLSVFDILRREDHSGCNLPPTSRSSQPSSRLAPAFQVPMIPAITCPLERVA